MASGYSIYGLLDENKNVRYIGVSANVEKRLKFHWASRNTVSHENKAKMEWLRTLDKRPEHVILESCESEDRAAEREKHWIAEFRPTGFLFNVANGGKGSPGVKQDAERIERRISVNRGKPLSADRRRKISDRLKGKNGYNRATVGQSRPLVDDLGRRYPSINEASRVLGIHRANIGAVLSGRARSAGGRSFEFVTKEQTI